MTTNIYIYIYMYIYIKPNERWVEDNTNQETCGGPGPSAFGIRTQTSVTWCARLSQSRRTSLRSILVSDPGIHWHKYVRQAAHSHGDCSSATSWYTPLRSTFAALVAETTSIRGALSWTHHRLQYIIVQCQAVKPLYKLSVKISNNFILTCWWYFALLGLFIMDFPNFNLTALNDDDHELNDDEWWLCIVSNLPWTSRKCRAVLGKKNTEWWWMNCIWPCRARQKCWAMLGKYMAEDDDNDYSPAFMHFFFSQFLLVGIESTAH